MISIDANDELVTHADGAHAMHNDGKWYSGMCLTMGEGATMNLSKKSGVVATSSTETDIVAKG